MLEIIAVMMLVNSNKKNAIQRGRKPGAFIALTLALWFGLEFLGFILGLAMGAEGVGLYLPALLLAAIGGVISYLVAKNCKTGEYVPPAEKAAADILNSTESLEVPATLEITRDKSMVGALVATSLMLNGRLIGSVRNGESTTEKTDRKHNILCIIDAYGNESQPYTFDMASGGHANIHFKAGRFLPSATTGTLPLSNCAAEKPGL